jgi:hypothetical protein
VVDTILYLCDTRDVLELEFKYTFPESSRKGSHVTLKNGLLVPVRSRGPKHVGIRMLVAPAPRGTYCRKPTAIDVGRCITANRADQVRELLERGADPNGSYFCSAANMSHTHLFAAIMTYLETDDHAVLDVIVGWPGADLGQISGKKLANLASGLIFASHQFAYVVRAGAAMLHNVDKSGRNTLHWFSHQSINLERFAELLQEDCLLALSHHDSEYHFTLSDDRDRLIKEARVRAKGLVTDVLLTHVTTRDVVLLIVTYL